MKKFIEAVERSGAAAFDKAKRGLKSAGETANRVWQNPRTKFVLGSIGAIVLVDALTRKLYHANDPDQINTEGGYGSPDVKEKEDYI